MQNLSVEAIQKMVVREICETLGVEESDVTQDARLVDDLGAESIDFVDLYFRFENRLSTMCNRTIILDRGGIGQQIKDRFPEIELKRTTILPLPVISFLNQAIPELKVPEQSNLSIADIPSLFTVRVLVVVCIEALRKNEVLV